MVHVAMRCRHRRHAAFLVGSILYSNSNKAAKKHPYIAPTNIVGTKNPLGTAFPGVRQVSKKIKNRPILRLVAEYAYSVSKQQSVGMVNE